MDLRWPLKTESNVQTRNIVMTIRRLSIDCWFRYLISGLENIVVPNPQTPYLIA
jgi:hypothetical protein